MTRFSATTLDYSRLPAPAVIKDLDYEAIVSERLADLKARFDDAGIPYDVDALETDPGGILQQEDAYRELLDKQSINDAVKAVLVPYATGSNLDALALRFGVVRLDGETDAALRHRVQLAPEAYSSAGTPGAYRYHALSVSAEIRDIGLAVPNPGSVMVSVLARAGDGTPDASLVTSVREILIRDDIRPLTDAVTVVPATIVPYAIDCKLLIPDGPDPAVVRTAAEDSIRLLTEERRRVGQAIHTSAILAAAHVSNVFQARLTAPTADIDVGDGACGYCSGIDVTVEVLA